MDIAWYLLLSNTTLLKLFNQKYEYVAVQTYVDSLYIFMQFSFVTGMLQF